MQDKHYVKFLLKNIQWERCSGCLKKGLFSKDFEFLKKNPTTLMVDSQLSFHGTLKKIRQPIDMCNINIMLKSC